MRSHTDLQCNPHSFSDTQLIIGSGRNKLVSYMKEKATLRRQLSREVPRWVAHPACAARSRQRCAQLRTGAAACRAAGHQLVRLRAARRTHYGP